MFSSLYTAQAQPDPGPLDLLLSSNISLSSSLRNTFCVSTKYYQYMSFPSITYPASFHRRLPESLNTVREDLPSSVS